MQKLISILIGVVIGALAFAATGNPLLAALIAVGTLALIAQLLGR